MNYKVVYFQPEYKRLGLIQNIFTLIHVVLRPVLVIVMLMILDYNQEASELSLNCCHLR